MTATLYKNYRTSPTEIGSGRVLAYGEPVAADELDLSEGSHDSALVADGALGPADPPAETEELRGRALDARIRRLGLEDEARNLSADEKRALVAAAEAGPDLAEQNRAADPAAGMTAGNGEEVTQ